MDEGSLKKYGEIRDTKKNVNHGWIDGGKLLFSKTQLHPSFKEMLCEAT